MRVMSGTGLPSVSVTRRRIHTVFSVRRSAFPLFVLAQARGPLHVTEPVDGSNRRGNEVVHRDVPSPFPWWYSLLVALVYHVSAPRVCLVAATGTLAYCLSGDVTEEC